MHYVYKAVSQTERRSGEDTEFVFLFKRNRRRVKLNDSTTLYNDYRLRNCNNRTSSTYVLLCLRPDESILGANMFNISR